MELRQYFQILLKWAWLIALGTILAGGTAFVVSKLMVPTYQASTTLLVSEATQSTVTDYTSIMTSERLAKTYGELLKKRPVLNEVIGNLGLGVDAEDLAGQVDVQLVRDTQLIVLSVTDTDPEQATRIAFGSDKDGPMDIFTIAVDGTDLVNLTNLPASDGTPSWSPDGHRIAFASDRDGNLEIYVLHLDTGTLDRLTNNDAVDFGPAWSPDGARIAFSSNYDGDHEICVMSSNGSGLQQLTDNDVDDVNPFWSPDGRYLAFSHDDSANADVYIISTERALLLPLTDRPPHDFGGSWTW